MAQSSLHQGCLRDHAGFLHRLLRLGLPCPGGE